MAFGVPGKTTLSRRASIDFKHVVARPDFRDASTQAPLAAVFSC
jgi:hypothetical protein